MIPESHEICVGQWFYYNVVEEAQQRFSIVEQKGALEFSIVFSEPFSTFNEGFMSYISRYTRELRGKGRGRRPGAEARGRDRGQRPGAETRGRNLAVISGYHSLSPRAEPGPMILGHDFLFSLTLHFIL
jgi:hypothetical protein